MNPKQWLFLSPFIVVVLPLALPIAIIAWAMVNIIEGEYYSPARIVRGLK